MPELRKDLLTDNWVIIAEERQDRPRDYSRQEGWEKSPSECPFEPGHESMTPPEIDAIGQNGNESSDWSVRVVPNKYNALSPEGNATRSFNGLFQSMKAVGSHEVVIETPEHSLELSQFPKKQMKNVLIMYKQRITSLLEDDRFHYVQLFRNEGREAGASLIHPHSQILAFPFIPLWIRDRLRASHDYFTSNENCIMCDLNEQELRENERIIADNELFTVISPYAARYPYETWIIPKRHSHDFRDLHEDEIEELAYYLPRTVGRLNEALNNPPFNVLLQTAPQNTGEKKNYDYLESLPEHFHWHLELIPRLKRTAGLELATDTHINTVSPETATNHLRDVEPVRGENRTP